MGASGLGGLLVDDGLLTESDRLTVRKTCGEAPAAFAKGIVALGLLSEDELASFLALRTNTRLASKDLKRDIDPEVLGLVDPIILINLEVIPIRLDEKRLLVTAMADPLDKGVIHQLSFFTGFQVRPVIATITQIRQALESLVEGYRPQLTELEIFLTNHADAAARQRQIYDEQSHSGHKVAVPTSHDSLKRYLDVKVSDAERQLVASSNDLDLQSLSSIDGDQDYNLPVNDEREADDFVIEDSLSDFGDDASKPPLDQEPSSDAASELSSMIEDTQLNPGAKEDADIDLEQEAELVSESELQTSEHLTTDGGDEDRHDHPTDDFDADMSTTSSASDANELWEDDLSAPDKLSATELEKDIEQDDNLLDDVELASPLIDSSDSEGDLITTAIAPDTAAGEGHKNTSLNHLILRLQLANNSDHALELANKVMDESLLCFYLARGGDDEPLQTLLWKLDDDDKANTLTSDLAAMIDNQAISSIPDQCQIIDALEGVRLNEAMTGNQYICARQPCQSNAMLIFFASNAQGQIDDGILSLLQKTLKTLAKLL